MPETLPGAVDKRAAQIAAIHGLADWLAENPGVPMPSLGLGKHLYDGTEIEQLATVRSVAAHLGTDADEELDDRTVLRFRVNEHVWYELFAWHRGGRAELSELARLRTEVEQLRALRPHPSWPTETEPRESLASSAARYRESIQPTSVAHYEKRGWKGDEPGTCGIECACGVSYDGFDSLAEAKQLLDWHISDPTGQDYGRNDTAEADDSTPVSPARGIAHVGGMTKGGLVDESGPTVQFGSAHWGPTDDAGPVCQGAPAGYEADCGIPGAHGPHGVQ